MKRLITLALAASFALGGLVVSSASAEEVCTEAGCARTGNGYTLLLDGNASNPDPFDGYLGVDDDGNVQCADAGDGTEWFDDNGNGVEDPGERRATDDGCNPGA